MALGMKYKRLFLFIIPAAMLMSCSNAGQRTTEEDGVETALPQEEAQVTVMTVQRQAFNHELVSNGKVTSQQYTDLYFRRAEVVAHVYVKNGDYVRRGQKLAELDLFPFENELTQRKNGLDQATLEMQDVLIGQGYAPDHMEAVPADVLQLARVKSGYEQQKALYEAAQHDLQQATLTAPMDGRVANLFQKPMNMANTSEAFCRIVSTGSMEVDFNVLESELSLIKIGDKVEVTPYAQGANSVQGSVSEINPLVDANGMVRVRARVSGRDLFDGMNVRVSVKRAVPDQLVVPKTAVVLRSDRQVLFTLENGRAYWNYVKTGLENLTEYTIIDGLEEGKQVIVTGNVNLAHESPVKIEN